MFRICLFFSGKEEFMKTMKRRLQNEAVPDGNKIRPRNHVLISDKSISDVVEALIGVHLANAGINGAAEFLSYLGLGFRPTDNIKEVLDYYQERKVEKDWFQLAHENRPKTCLWMIRESGSFDAHIDRKDIEETLDDFMQKIK